MKRTKKVQEGIVEEALKRFDRAVEHDRDERELAIEDCRFVFDEDAQWTEAAKSARQGRPTMTFDRLSGALDQVMGDHLQNRPGIKIRAVEDGDTDLAETYTGLIRNIESSSNAKRAYSTAFKFTTAGGYGCWRIEHDYTDEDSFDQDLTINPIANPFTVFFDPMAEKVTKEDGKFCIIIRDMDKEEFEDLYPKATTGLNSYQLDGLASDWFNDDTVRVAEYYRKQPAKKTILRLSDGKVVDKDIIGPILDELEQQGVTVEAEREVDGWDIEHFLINGVEILEEYKCASKFIPVVPVYGKNINLEGKHKYRGMIRPAKDAQRLYNYELSNMVEHSALAPKQPYLATPDMIEGHESQWQNLNTRNDPVLMFNGPQPPMRQPPMSPSSGNISLLQFAGDNIKSQTGIYDASMGARSNETSGKAIIERDRQGDTATFEFTDELVESLELTGRILVDMIPKIYDSERMIRVLGEDEAEEIVKINQTVMDLQTGKPVILNDLSKGRYDVIVKTGASYSTKRTETTAQLGQIMAQNPEAGQMFLDIYFKSMDLVGADEVHERVRKMLLQKGIIEPNEEEQKAAQTPQAQQQAQLKQQAQQMKMQDAKLDLALKEAEVKNEQAKAGETQSKTALNTVKAQVEQLALAQAQGDQLGQQQIMQRLQMMLNG